jgi:hypothetical protein
MADQLFKATVPVLSLLGHLIKTHIHNNERLMQAYCWPVLLDDASASLVDHRRDNNARIWMLFCQRASTSEIARDS